MDWTQENLRRIRAYDADWDESKHPRADNGQFSSGGGGGGAVNTPEDAQRAISELKSINSKYMECGSIDELEDLVDKFDKKYEALLKSMKSKGMSDELIRAAKRESGDSSFYYNKARKKLGMSPNYHPDLLKRMGEEKKWEAASAIPITTKVKNTVLGHIAESYGFDAFITRLNHEAQQKYDGVNGQKCWPSYAPVPGTMKLKKLNKRVFTSSLSPEHKSWDHNVEYVVECEFQDEGRGPGWKKGPDVKREIRGSFVIDPQLVEKLGLAKSYDDFMKEPK